jgi:hypothetical protein
MDNGGNSSETLNCFLLVQDTVHWWGTAMEVMYLRVPYNIRFLRN